MIIAELLGGLGNQLFQYAFGYATAKRLKTRLYLYTSLWYETEPRWHVELDAFSISAKNMPQEELLRIKINFPQFKQFDEKITNFDPITARIPNFTFLSGYWQTAKYFAGYEDSIRKELQFASPPTDPEIIKYAGLIASKPNSVALHVRLKDYVDMPYFHAISKDICNRDYYDKAIQHIIDKTGAPVNIFVFSDDIMNVKNHISFSHEVTLIQTSDAIRPPEIMRLMSLCDHNIIANSTFSWWGAWLNDNPAKIIIAPDPWFHAVIDRPKDTNVDTVPETWVKIGKGQASI